MEYESRHMRMDESVPLEPYHHVRFTWRLSMSPSDVVQRFKKDFDVTLPTLRSESWYDLSPYKGYRWEILVKADTLAAFVSAGRAVLFQKVSAPFTKKDLELRKIVFTLYPHNRPTPFPWLFSREPPFEVEKD